MTARFCSHRSRARKLLMAFKNRRCELLVLIILGVELMSLQLGPMLLHHDTRCSFGVARPKQLFLPQLLGGLQANELHLLLAAALLHAPF